MWGSPVPCGVTHLAEEMSVDKATPAGAETAAGAEEEAKKEVEEEVKLSPREQLERDLAGNVKLLVACVSTKEQRYAARAMRTLTSIRRRLTAPTLRGFIESTLQANPQLATTLQYYLKDFDSDMDVDESSEARAVEKDSSADARAKAAAQPEIEAYVQLMMTIFLLDRGHVKEAAQCAESLCLHNTSKHQNRSTMDLVLARSFFYFARSMELQNNLRGIRNALLAAYRTATLRNNVELQATLLNELVRSYLQDHMYDQADKLLVKSKFPEQASTNALARHLYYLARVKIVQLHYSAALDYLTQSLRKAPPNAATGFLQTVQKLIVVGNLLMGDLPERSVFREAKFKRSLMPYLALVRSVQSGDLGKFHEVVGEHQAKFESDGNLKLVWRLRQNVIKSGVKKINLSYSRISLEDICQKLRLDSTMEAEFIVAKAIRDGVIDAKINHEQGWVESKEGPDVYSTSEPQVVLNERIAFCIDVHNNAVQGMRYPPKNYNRNETVEQRLEREREEKEIANSLAEEDDF